MELEPRNFINVEPATLKVVCPESGDSYFPDLRQEASAKAVRLSIRVETALKSGQFLSPTFWEEIDPAYGSDEYAYQGTEAMRDGLHTNVWVNALMSRYPYNSIINEINSKTDGSYGVKQPNWIITDMRFPNEMDAVKERKGITIRVSRTGIHTPKAEDLHPSETSLDDAEFDYHIDNSGTIEDLIEKVKEILIKENII